MMIDKHALAVLIMSLISLFLAQTLKFIAYSIIQRKLNLKMWYSTGGMPSSHSALVSTLMLSILLFDGLTYSSVIAIMVGIVIIHDAMGVRYEASKHATILNQMIDDWDDEKTRLELQEASGGKSLKEMLGHKPKEAIGGVAFGFIIAIIGYLICHFCLGL